MVLLLSQRHDLPLAHHLCDDARYQTCIRDASPRVSGPDMADENDPPPESKLTRSKERWAREGKFLTGRISRPEEARLPPGQHLTKDWPTLDLGLTPNISRERVRLDAYGAVENPLFWTSPSSPRSRRASSFPTFTASPPGRATTISGRGWRRTISWMPAGRARKRVSWCCIAMTPTPPVWRWKTLPPRTPSSSIAGRARRSSRSMAARR